MGAVAAVAAEFEALPRWNLAASLKPELPDRRPVCVTSGASFLGAALVRCLLGRGHAVRVAVDDAADVEKVREEGAEGVVVVDLAEIDSLREAFDGCAAVFHTGGFADPRGVSGYTKLMAELEVAAAENVVTACARTTSVRKCVFTSSLLACVWLRDHPCRTVDERCWSDEGLCRDKKLWFALGKTMAERAAWRRVQGTGIRLASICPGLLVGRDFHLHNTTASIAYLKGGGEMYRQNVLAIVDLEKVVKAHVAVYESMNDNAGWRYICFDHIINTADGVLELEQKLGLPSRITTQHNSLQEIRQPLMLSNSRLSMLTSRTLRCSHYLCYPILD